MTVLLGSLQAAPFLYRRLRMCMKGWAKSKPQLLRGGLGDLEVSATFRHPMARGFRSTNYLGIGHPLFLFSRTLLLAQGLVGAVLLG